MRVTRGLGLPPWHPAVLIATFFGVGFLPIAPGTFGSLAALPVAWLVREFAGREGLTIAWVVLFAAGWWASSRIVEKSREKDPQCVVIDEVAAQGLLLAAVPQSLIAYALAFVFFRLFDILKPPPARWIEENVAGGLGVMLDDAVAGGYALAVSVLLFAIGRASGVLF
jgi:phosphatidylglycerophosphatase A